MAPFCVIAASGLASLSHQHSVGEPILKAIGVLRHLESGELKKLPDDVNTSFIKEAWRNGVLVPQQGM